MVLPQAAARAGSAMVERSRLALLAALPGLALARAGAAADAPDAADTGRFVEHLDIPSREFPRRKVVVWLPPGYARGRRRYGVLYAQDGQNLFAPANPFGNGPWDVDGHLRRLTAAGVPLRPVIVVAIENGGLDRSREYQPAAAIETLPAELQRLAPEASSSEDFSPRSDQYVDYMVKDLKPFIDRHYRTRRDRADTFLLGSSKGGLISLYALCRAPAVFGGAACLSTHWIVTTRPALLGPPLDPRVARMAGAWQAWLAGHLPRAGRHRLYFDHGTLGLDAHYGPWQARMDALAHARGYRDGVDYLSRVLDGADHNERAWRARLAEPLTFLLAP